MGFGSISGRRPGRGLQRQEGTGADDPQLYAGELFGIFSYTIPVTPGTYSVVIHMAERWLGPGQPGGKEGPGSRLFDISM